MRLCMRRGWSNDCSTSAATLSIATRFATGTSPRLASMLGASATAAVSTTDAMT